jgi:hypothetical protein
MARVQCAQNKRKQDNAAYSALPLALSNISGRGRMEVVFLVHEFIFFITSGALY